MGVIGADIEVVSGKDGWLFLSAFGSNRFLEVASDLSAWRKNILPKHASNFRARHKRMADRGMPFVVMLAPEASGIYPEFLPENLSVESPTVGEILAARLAQEGIDAFCPSETLRRAKGPVDLYCRTDSHWSFSGAYIAYRMLMDRVQKHVPANVVAPLSIELKMQRSYGDLGVHVDPERIGLTEVITIDGFETFSFPTLSDFRDKNIKQFKCSQGQSRALIFRDSFANALSPYLERSFAETIMIAPTPVLIDEAIDYYNPDIVIMEIAERGLFKAEDPFNDWSVRSFSQDYLETASNPAGARHQIDAVRAIQSGNFHQALINASVGVALSEGEPRVYNLAWALSGLGARSEARLLARTFAEKTGDRFLHYIDADAAYHLSDMQGALKSISAALELQPNNGLFLFLKGAWLHDVGRTEEAAGAIEASLSYAPLHLRSWKLLVDIYTHLGRHDDAQQARAGAAALFPEVADEA
jgi:tetratricopeptide (TPR) repeat protein